MYLQDHPGMPQGLDDAERQPYCDAIVLVEAAVIEADAERLHAARGAAAEMQAAEKARHTAMANVAKRGATMKGAGEAA